MNKKITCGALIAIIILIIASVWFFSDNKKYGENTNPENQKWAPSITIEEINEVPKEWGELVSEFIKVKYADLIEMENFIVTYLDDEIVIKEEIIWDDSIKLKMIKTPYKIEWNEVKLIEGEAKILFVCHEWRWQQIPSEELCK